MLKAQQFIDAQRLLLRQQNERAINANTKDLETYQKQLSGVQDQLNKFDEDGDLFQTISAGFRRTVNGIDPIIKNVKLTAEETEALTERSKELQKQILDTQNAIKFLSGESLDTGEDTRIEQEINYQKAKLKLLEELAAKGDELAHQEIAPREKLAKELTKIAEREAKRRQREAEREAAEIE
ncbi:MAG: hypothetical protein AAFP19_20025 [Bacteroidota bacterium]